MSDLTKLQKELEAVRRQENQLAAKLKAAQDARIGALPASVGLSTIDELIKALVPYGSPKMKARFGGAAPAPAKAAADKAPKAEKGGKRRRKRAKITDETRAKVKELVQAGKTGADIAKTLGISLPSVQNIKSAAGLVNKRK